MTSSSSEPLTQAPDLADFAPAGTEQRGEERIRTVYLPCCLRTDERCTVGLIRNFSQGGLMVETAIEAEPGSEIVYFQEGAHWRRARVMWRDGARVGLLNIDEGEDYADRYPQRALRVPTSLIGRLWINSRASEIGIGNMSHKGVLAFGVAPLERGQLVTLNIAGREFANTSVRWWADGSAGLQFARPMTLRSLTELVEQADRSGIDRYFEHRAGELLEVVPANDARK